jgi:DNA modification methylase
MSDVTLHLGDCLEYMRRMPDRCVDMVFTDPPYGHNNNNGDLIHRWEAALSHPPSGSNPPQGRPIANDGEEANDLFRTMIAELPRLLRNGGCCCCCCCGGGGPDPQFARWSLWMDQVLDFKQMIVWDKGPMGMGWHYRRSYETVLVGEKRGGPCKWYDNTKSVENIIRPGQYGIRKIIPSSDQHPTQKPWQLASHFIGLHTAPGDVVFDPFMGSGQTGIAANRLGRSFVGCEIDPHWFEVAKTGIADAQQQPPLFVMDTPKHKQMALIEH